MRLVGLLTALCLMVAACGSDQPPTDTGTATEPETDTNAGTEPRFPDVTAVTLVATGDGVFDVSVTVSSPYDTPERYADAWRVLSSEGDVLGERILTHDHAAEQPFTRSLGGVVIDESVGEVTVQARDLRNGWGGATVTVPVPR